MRTIIITVGTSLLTNDRVGIATPRPWPVWRSGQPLPDQALAGPYLRDADPRDAGAEVNSLDRLPVGDTDLLVWLASNTTEGRWCAEALHAHYGTLGHQSEVCVVEGLDYHHGSFVERGLRSLMNSVSNAVRKAGGPGNAVFLATGGFKAEIAYLTLAGVVLGVDVYYLHERFEEIIALPRLPLNWDINWVEERRSFFEWIDGEQRRTSEVENRLRAQGDLRPLVADDIDGCSYLTPVGELLYRAYRERSAFAPPAVWPAADGRLPQDKNGVSDVAHHRPPGWERFVDRLTLIAWVSRVSYAGQGHGRGASRSSIFSSDSDTGRFGIIYWSGNQELPLWVDTTARGDDQLSLVRGWLDQNIGRW